MNQEFMSKQVCPASEAKECTYPACNCNEYLAFASDFGSRNKQFLESLNVNQVSTAAEKRDN